VVIHDSTTWIAQWSDLITVAAPPAITLTATTSNKATAYVNETATYTTTWSTGDPIQFYYYIYRDGALVYSLVTDKDVFKYKFPAVGTYTEMTVATDGYNWTSIWGDTVVVSSVNAFAINSVTVEHGTAKTYFEPFTVVPVFTGNTPITQIYYEVYNNSNQLMAKWNGTKASYTFQPPLDTSITSYRVMVVATNGTEWVSMFSPEITYSKPAALSITAVTNNTATDVISLGQSVEFTGVTLDGAALQGTEFVVYYNDGIHTETVVERVNGNSTSYAFTPSNKGEYRVMFVAYDGITWASMYSDVVTVQ